MQPVKRRNAQTAHISLQISNCQRARRQNKSARCTSSVTNRRIFSSPDFRLNRDVAAAVRRCLRSRAGRRKGKKQPRRIFFTGGGMLRNIWGVGQFPTQDCPGGAQDHCAGAAASARVPACCGAAERLAAPAEAWPPQNRASALASRPWPAPDNAAPS